MRIAGREDAASGAVHVTGNIESAAKFHRRIVAAAGPDLGTEQRCRPFGFGQNVGKFFNVGRIADRFSRGAIGTRLGEYAPARAAL